MTRKDIIDGLRYTVDMFLFNPTTGETYTEPRNDMDKITIDACRGAIELLEQEPKTGHWIIHGEPPINVIECSECGQKYHNHYCQPLAHFCSMCGCRMVEPQESEEV